MEEKMRCSACGVNLTEGTASEFEGNIYCDDCLNEKTVLCMNCNERIWRAEAEGNENLVLCRNCYDYNYTNCDECGRMIHNDSAYYESEDDD